MNHNYEDIPWLLSVISTKKVMYFVGASEGFGPAMILRDNKYWTDFFRVERVTFFFFYKCNHN